MFYQPFLALSTAPCTCCRAAFEIWTFKTLLIKISRDASDNVKYYECFVEQSMLNKDFSAM